VRFLLQGRLMPGRGLEATETLQTAEDSIFRKPQVLLARMKRAAVSAIETEFNWEAAFTPYRDAIVRLIDTRPEVAEGV
jgi:hypothetical protein